MMRIIITIFFLTSVMCFSQVDKKHSPLNDSVKIFNKKTKVQNIIENYLTALGGRKNLEKINDIKISLTGSVQGVKVKMVICQKIPNKYYQKVSLGTTKQKTIFNGKRGYTIIDDNPTRILGDDLEKLKYEAAMRLMLLLKAYNVNAVFVSERILNDKSAYEIKLIFPSRMKWTQFYDTKTGLKIKELKPVITLKDTIMQETFFDNYTEVNGIKYPFKIKQTLGRQYYEFTVDSIKINTGLSSRNFEIEE